MLPEALKSCLRDWATIGYKRGRVREMREKRENGRKIGGIRGRKEMGDIQRERGNKCENGSECWKFQVQAGGCWNVCLV